MDTKGIGRTSMRWVGVGVWALSLTLAPARAHGQVLIGILFGDKISSPTFHLGLNAGLNLSNLTEFDDTKILPGLLLGLSGEWNVGGNWYLQPELVPFSKRGADDLSAADLVEPPDISDRVDVQSASRRLSYFDIPVIVKYGLLARRLHLGVGPYISFLTGAEDSFSAVTLASADDIGFSISTKDDFESIDYGLVFHAEYKLSPSAFSTSLNLRYQLGLADLDPRLPSGSSRNRTFQLFATIAMGDDESTQEAGR